MTRSESKSEAEVVDVERCYTVATFTCVEIWAMILQLLKKTRKNYLWVPSIKAKLAQHNRNTRQHLLNKCVRGKERAFTQEIQA